MLSGACQGAVNRVGPGAGGGWPRGMLGVVATAWRGVRAAWRARPGTALAIAAGVLALDVLLPPLLLSVVRTPWTYVAVNPWLARLPEYLASDVPLARKLDFLPRLALLWFTADGPYGYPEWGFAVDTTDVVRFLGMALLVATYFALWLHGRAGAVAAVPRAGGVAGALVSVLGLSTGPCSVVGCGAPVLPAVGLVFTGLSSGTLALLSAFSKAAISVVLAVLAVAVVYQAWRVGAALPPRSAPPGRRPGC